MSTDKSVIEDNLTRMLSETINDIAGVDRSRSDEIDIDRITPWNNPRRHFDGEAIARLADSIRVHGVLQPLVVCPDPSGSGYRLIAGERRYRAARLAGLQKVPVIVRDCDEETARTLALIENVQREDLNPYEETVAILDLIAAAAGVDRQEAAEALKSYAWYASRKVGLPPDARIGRLRMDQVEALFEGIGKYQWKHFALHRLRLLEMPEDVRHALESGEVSYSVAVRFLCRKELTDEQRAMLLQMAKTGATCRQIEESVRKMLGKNDSRKGRPGRAALPGRYKSLRSMFSEGVPQHNRERIIALLDQLLALMEDAEADAGSGNDNDSAA